MLAFSRSREKDYDKAKGVLCSTPGMKEEEVVHALKIVGYPYGLQQVTQTIHEARKDCLKPDWRFEVKAGMQIKKVSEGKMYLGKVMYDNPEVFKQDGKDVKMWEVEYEHNTECRDDMDINELFRCRLNRSEMLAHVRGRQLQCLELFSGQGIVSHEFRDRRWGVASLDSDPRSNATIRRDILEVDPSELEFVPDFIWASPPCETYSNLAGGKHRKPSVGELEKTSKAMEHNYNFQKMAHIMHWAKERHPHLVVAIENPVGSLQRMPLMIELVKSLHLYMVTVNYCAFGRKDKKPTNIWTNDPRLSCMLGVFTCKNKCGLRNHDYGVRDQGHLYDASAIPQYLAEEVAEYMTAKFYFDDIRDRKAVSPKQEEKRAPMQVAEVEEDGVVAAKRKKANDLERDDNNNKRTCRIQLDKLAHTKTIAKEGGRNQEAHMKEDWLELALATDTRMTKEEWSMQDLLKELTDLLAEDKEFDDSVNITNYSLRRFLSGDKNKTIGIEQHEVTAMVLSKWMEYKEEVKWEEEGKMKQIVKSRWNWKWNW